jgi:hypothetical protein
MNTTAGRVLGAGLLLLVAQSLSAATLFRCKGAHGETVFASSPSGFSECKKFDIPVAPPGWQFLGKAPGVNVYLNERRTPPSAPGGWVLWSYDVDRRANAINYRSQVSRYLVNCATRTATITSTTLYRGADMSGDSVYSGSVAQAIDPIPGTFDDMIISQLCTAK